MNITELPQSFTELTQNIWVCIGITIFILGIITEVIRGFKDVLWVIKNIIYLKKIKDIKKNTLITETLLVKNYHTLMKIIHKTIPKKVRISFHYYLVITLTNQSKDDIVDLKCTWIIKKNNMNLTDNINEKDDNFNISAGGNYYYYLNLKNITQNFGWKDIETDETYQIEISIFWRGIRIKKHERFDLVVIENYEKYETEVSLECRNIAGDSINHVDQ